VAWVISPADERSTGTIGDIPVDAVFSPVSRCDYKVEETRVGRFTNYDKLTLEIWTDATITPKDALVKSAQILVASFNQIVSPVKVEKPETEKVETDTLGPVRETLCRRDRFTHSCGQRFIQSGLRSNRGFSESQSRRSGQS
jgi:DNA-directed RNA polymerase alpha subunit